jgi:selenocysteine-specific elongation factor
LLRRRMPVRVHVGSAEIPAHLRFPGGLPTDTTPVRAHVVLWKPAVFYPGMRTIIRRLSPKDLLGGAVLSSSQSLEIAGDFEEAPQGTNEVFAVVRAAALTPLSAAKIAAQANVVLALAEDSLTWLAEHGRIVQLQKPTEYIAREPFEGAFKEAGTLLRERHTQAPWRLGLATDEVAKAIGAPAALAIRLLHAWQEDGRISSRGGAWHAADFSPSLTKEQRSFFENAMAVQSHAPHLPHSHATLVAAAAARSNEMVEALDSLLAVGAFIKIGDDVYRRSQLDRARDAINAVVGEHGQATMAQLRDVLGTSRKYALPLMEYFDSIGFTIRDGDLRRLRKAK